MTRVSLTEETEKELEKAKKFYLQMEEFEDRDDVARFKHRHANRKMDRDYIIREALKKWIKENEAL